MHVMKGVRHRLLRSGYRRRCSSSFLYANKTGKRQSLFYSDRLRCGIAGQSASQSRRLRLSFQLSRLTSRISVRSWFMDDDEEPLTLTREDLYELAWSKPTSALAKDFGISDVALAKRCRRLGIPIPGRGYWARIDAGQTPYRPKLPKRDPQWRDQNALTVAPSVGAYSATILASEEAQETLKSAAPESVPARIAELSIVPTTAILEALAPVKRTAFHAKHPRRSLLTFERGEKNGPVVALDVTIEALDRALLFADTVLRAAASLGWEFDDPLALRKKQGLPVQTDQSQTGRTANTPIEQEPYRGRLLVEGEQVAFHIEERFRDEPIEPTAAQLVREKREYGYH